MDRLKNEAEHLRFGIRGGWLNVEQAVAWADRQIAQSPAPHPALLDVALARNRSREEVVALLSEFGWEPTALDDEFALAERGVYGTVFEAQERLLTFLRMHSARPNTY